jgi:peptidoglycan hydrolase CwlO-like protein
MAVEPLRSEDSRTEVRKDLAMLGSKVDHLDGKIDALRVELNEKIDATRVALEAKIDASHSDLEAKIAALDKKFRVLIVLMVTMFGIQVTRFGILIHLKTW